MTMDRRPRARVSMAIDAPPCDIYRAFVEPDWLTRFWLSSASAPLAEGRSVHWSFMVEGAEVDTTATRLVDDKAIEWRWGESTVRIDLEPFEGGTAVTIINGNFPGSEQEQVDAALDSTEGFAIVLSDLKTLLERGTSAGLTRGKARLIEARSS